MLPICSPDALIQSPKFSHQFCGSFVLVAAQVVHGLYGLWGGLQLVFIDVDAFVLGFNTNRVCSCWRILDIPHPSVLYLLPRFNHAGCVSQDVDVLVFVVLVNLWPRFKQWLHEQIQKGRNSNLEEDTTFHLMESSTGTNMHTSLAPSPHQLHRRWVHTAEHLE